MTFTFRVPSQNRNGATFTHLDLHAFLFGSVGVASVHGLDDDRGAGSRGVSSPRSG